MMEVYILLCGNNGLLEKGGQEKIKSEGLVGSSCMPEYSILKK